MQNLSSISIKQPASPMKGNRKQARTNSASTGKRPPATAPAEDVVSPKFEARGIAQPLINDNHRQVVDGEIKRNREI